jgi:large subunit ribosomal protein L14e
MNSDFHLGEIVISIAGRDLNKNYVVVGIINQKYLKLADGNYKKIDRPKKKNIKHLKSTGFIDKELNIWLTEGKRIRNEDLKWIIRNYAEKQGG